MLSRHDELKERARLLLEQTKKEAREKERCRRQKEKEDAKAEMNGVKNGELSPKKVSVYFIILDKQCCLEIKLAGQCPPSLAGEHNCKY